MVSDSRVLSLPRWLNAQTSLDMRLQSQLYSLQMQKTFPFRSRDVIASSQLVVIRSSRKGSNGVIAHFRDLSPQSLDGCDCGDERVFNSWHHLPQSRRQGGKEEGEWSVKVFLTFFAIFLWSYLSQVSLVRYRYGSICIPSRLSVEEMRRECAFYQLPDDVKITRERAVDVMPAFARELRECKDHMLQHVIRSERETIIQKGVFGKPILSSAPLKYALKLWAPFNTDFELGVIDSNVAVHSQMLDDRFSVCPLHRPFAVPP